MATSNIQDTDDILLCPICLEKLRNPKYLPCLHTFCEDCISTYITSGFEKGKKQTLECPVCRNIVPAPKDDCSPREWAKQLPLNFLIIGLLDREKVQRPEKQCMSCERIEVSTTANFICLKCADILCDTCCKCHKTNKYTLEHEIKLLSDVRSDDDFLKSFKNKCSEHPMKNLKLFCVDHDTPCCSMCVTITHRKCGDIISIEDAAKQFLSKKKVENVQSDLQCCKKHIKSIINSNKIRLSDLESQYLTKLETIENKYRTLVTEVQSIENLRKSELLKLYEEKKDEIETTKVAFENRLKAIENEEEILRVSISKASEIQVMIESKKIMHKSEEHKQFLTEGNIKCDAEYKLKLSNLEQFEKITEQVKDVCQVSCEVIQTQTSQLCAKTNDNIIEDNVTMLICASEADEPPMHVNDACYSGPNSGSELSIFSDDDTEEHDFTKRGLQDSCTMNLEPLSYVASSLFSVSGRDPEEVHRIERFKSTKEDWPLNTKYTYAVAIEVSVDVYLTGVMIFGSSKTHSCNVDVSVYIGSLVQTTKRILLHKTIKGKFIDVIFEKPIKLLQNRKYDIVIEKRTKGQYTSFYGQYGQAIVQTENVAFSFSPSTKHNSTMKSVEEGLIAGLIFQKL